MHLDLRSPRRRAAQGVRSALHTCRRWISAGVLIAAFGALVVGLAGAGVGQWAGWRTAGPLPDDAQAAAIARLALGGLAPGSQRRDHLFGYADGGYGPGYVRFTVPAAPTPPAFAWQAEDVRVRLKNAGWRVDRAWKAGRNARKPVTEPPDGVVFVADKGHWRVRFSTAGTRQAHLDLIRAQPLWVLPGGALGGLVGAVLGWLGGGFAARQWRRLDPHADGRLRRLLVVLAGFGAVALLPALGTVAAQQLIGYIQLSRPQLPLWMALTSPAVRALAVIGVVALLAALGTALRARPTAVPAGEPVVDRGLRRQGSTVEDRTS